MLNISNYLCPQCKKRMKLVSGLKKHLNSYTSLPLHIQPKKNMLISTKDDKKEKYPQDSKKQGVEKDQKDLISKNFVNEIIRNRLFGHIPQDGFFATESTFFSKQIKFNE